MLKKWLKKRRSGSSKHVDGGFEASVSTNTNASSPPRKQRSASRLLGTGKSKSGKTKSPSRKSNYKNIEKQESRLSYSHPIITPIVGQRSAKQNSKSSVMSKTELIISPPSSSDSNPKARIAEVTVTTSDNKIENDEIKGTQGETQELPLIKIKPIRGPRDHPRTSVFKASSDEQKKEAPPPPAAEMLARDMSYLGVASFPSIDTALFAHKDGEEDEDPMATHYAEILAPDRDSPPSIIQAVLPAECEAEETKPVARDDVAKPLKDDDLLTGRPSQAGTGSKKLEAWLNEVNRSIEFTRRSQNAADFDRYHVANDETIVEEKSEKGVVLEIDHHEAEEVLLEIDHQEALMESQNKIEQSLRETIQKSMAQKSASPKGILKVKTVENGTVQDEGLTDISSGESSDPISEDSGVQRQRQRTMAIKPIKVFSKSRRQRLREGSFSTDDEATSSIASQSSSGSEIAYETLRQLHPSVSRDDTQKTQNSAQGLYSQICDIGSIMEDYENDLCHMDDAMSITDDTVTSRSTISKDSYAVHQGGWLCFSPY